MNISAILSVLVVIIGGICTLLLVSTKTLRDSRDDQEKRITFLESKSDRDDDTISGQAAQIDALRKVVTGEVHLVAILDLLTQHHNEATQNWSHVTETLEHVDATIAELVRTMRRDQT